MNKYKYGRTPHLPYSEGVGDDDRKLESDEHFYKMNQVVVTTKMDGENTTVYPDGTFHARSIDSIHRDYHSWLLRDIQNWCYKIPKGYRVCGEYLYAKHSIEYDNLPSYFMCFSIWNEEKCLSWKRTKEIAKELGIYIVPELFIGRYNEDLIKHIAENVISNGQEGIVVRNTIEYNISEMGMNIAKYVRKGHVQTDQHWSLQKIEVNRLVKKIEREKE